MSELGAREEKAIDVASTYVQVLIGLASGIITAILAFYPDVTQNNGFNLQYLKISLIIFGVSVICGLTGLGALVNQTAGTSKTPTDEMSVRIPVALQLITFGIGIMVMIVFVIPG